MNITVHAYPRADQESSTRHSEASASPLTRRAYYRPQPQRRRPRAATRPTRQGASWWPAPPESDELGPSDAVWLSRDAWLDALETALRTEAAGTKSVTLTRRLHVLRVRVDTILDVATVDAAAADSATGRHVTTAHATVAKAVGCSPATVERARTIIQRLGYATTEERGRYLTTAERERAYEVHGRRQTRMASTRALIMPRPPVTAGVQEKENDELPRRGSFNPYSPVRNNHLTRAHARAGGKRSKKKNSQRPTIAIQKLAAHLAERLPSLSPAPQPGHTHRPEHIGRLCAVLTSVGIDPAQWTARDIEEALNARNAAQHRDSLHRSAQRNPMALLAHQLREILATTTETHSQRIRREAAQIAAKREAERLAAQAAPPIAPKSQQHTAAEAARAAARPARNTYLDSTHRWTRQPYMPEN